jgi:L-cystine transport system substrate-binding protein
MKKRELYVLLSVVLLAGLLAACNKKPASGADAPLTVKNLIVGVFPGSNVLSFYDKDNNLTGLEIELIREIDERLPQYTVEFVPIEYRSMFASLKSNRVDIVTSNLRRNGEREDYLHTYRGLNYWVNKIVVLSDNTTINSIDDLEGKRLCTPQGTLSAIFMEN